MQDAQESRCDSCGIKHQSGYCKALGQICLGCGTKVALRRCARVEVRAISHTGETEVLEE